MSVAMVMAIDNFMDYYYDYDHPSRMVFPKSLLSESAPGHLQNAAFTRGSPESFLAAFRGRGTLRRRALRRQAAEGP
jgi:hypothetical protein